MSKIRIAFMKEDLENRSKEDLQKTVERCIEEGLCPPGTTVDDVPIYEPPKLKPVVYMTSELWEDFKDDIDDGNFVGLLVLLKSIVHTVDVETMKKIQQVVEKEENKR